VQGYAFWSKEIRNAGYSYRYQLDTRILDEVIEEKDLGK